MTQPHVGVLLGGLSAEREVSIATGEAVCEALRSRGHRVTPIDVDAHLDRALAEAAIDVAFIALHGTYGEDGCVQGMLELLGIPYTGAGVLASALAMDKLKSKELFRLYNVPTPPYYGVDAADATDLGALVRAHGSFGFPVFVKPRSNGSSVGAGRADDVEQLAVRVQDALRFDRSALVERFVDGREIAVGLLDGKALGAIEIEPTGRFYDYHSKYTRGGSVYHLPARLSPTRYQGVLNLAERAVRCVGATGATRVDLLVTEGDNEYVLEVNTLPGMTKTSLLPKIAKAAGYEFADLCEAILDGARLEHPHTPEQPTLSAAAEPDAPALACAE
ncbi:MAG: D-alanine--D-alanine ligase [Myxococcales bacterium]|nr:D-alanine--D-alanine ligase [Myxococcales bacterium]